MNILTHIKDNFLLFDGAFGTVLMDGALQPGENPSVLNLTKPEIVAGIHRNYLESGAMVVTLNTFSASRYKIEGLPYSLEELAKGAFDCAHKAVEQAGKPAYLIYDIGPCGKLLEPMGEVSFDEAYDIYKEQALLAEQYGADAILLETEADLYEVKAGLLAAKENTGLPVFCSITLEQNGRTYTGGCVESAAAMLEALGADAVGLNCSVGPKDLLPYAKRLTEVTGLPVLVQPNAGLPKEHGGVTTFDVTPDEFAKVMEELAKCGVRILGGCCGTNYACIRELSGRLNGLSPVKSTAESKPCGCTPSVYVEVTAQTPVFELITQENAAEIGGYMAGGDYDSIIDLALDQIYDMDAAYMNLNCTLLSGVSPEQAAEAVKALQTAVRLPFGITAVSEEEAMKITRYYNGKPYVTVK